MAPRRTIKGGRFEITKCLEPLKAACSQIAAAVRQQCPDFDENQLFLDIFTLLQEKCSNPSPEITASTRLDDDEDDDEPFETEGDGNYAKDLNPDAGSNNSGENNQRLKSVASDGDDFSVMGEKDTDTDEESKDETEVEEADTQSLTINSKLGLKMAVEAYSKGGKENTAIALRHLLLALKSGEIADVAFDSEDVAEEATVEKPSVHEQRANKAHTLKKARVGK